MTFPNSSFIARGALTAFLLSAGLLAVTGTLDSRGERTINATLTRALVAFGIARGLNGVISVVQGTEIALQPAGVGLTFAPGEILDPVNDLVERFSWVMLASSASLGTQKILLAVSAWPVFTAITLLTLAITALALWTPLSEKPAPMRFLVKCSLVLILFRFLVPVIAISSEFLYDRFLSSQYHEAAGNLERTTETIGQLHREASQDIPLEPDATLWESASRFYKSSVSQLDFESRVERYKEAASNVTHAAINLIVVFLVQTILFPLAFMAGAYLLLRSLVTIRPGRESGGDG